MGTVHFKYLFEAGGGLLTSATSFDEHLTQLDQVLANPSTEIRPFVRAFVRPHGLNVAATPLFVEHVEAMQGLQVTAPDRPRWNALALWILNKVIASRNDVSREHLLYSEREVEKIARLRNFHETKAAHEREKKARERTEKAEKMAARERARKKRELAVKTMKAAAKERRT
jgi:hypothetical protein